MSRKHKKIIKVLSLVFVLMILTGCASNLDASGTLIESRAITSATPWSLKDNGIFDFIFVLPIAKFIIFIEPYIGVAFGLILATVIINMITLPLMIKSQISSQKMQMIQPKVEAIQRKYKGRSDQASQMRQNAEIQALYKKNEISMGASLVSFLSFPIMIAMWQAVQRVQIVYTSTFLGFNLGETPSANMGDWRYIALVAVVAISQFFSIEINTILMKKQAGYRPNAAMNSMRYMNVFMIFMIGYMSFTMASVMSLYWITTSIISLVRSLYIFYGHTSKIKHDEDTSYLTKKKK